MWTVRQENIPLVVKQIENSNNESCRLNLSLSSRILFDSSWLLLDGTSLGNIGGVLCAIQT